MLPIRPNPVSPQTGLVDLLVDLGDLLDPYLALPVFHVQDLVRGPVEVVCDVSYLLVQLVQGVAYDSPTLNSPPRSISNRCLHSGHET